MSTIDKIAKCSTLEELAKLSTLQELKSALKSYLKSKVYHAAHNAKNAQMIKAYRKEHPEIS